MEKGQKAFGVGIVLLAGALARLFRFEGNEGYILIIIMFYVLNNRPSWQKILIFIPVLFLARYRLLVYSFGHLEMLRTCMLNVLGHNLGVLVLFKNLSKNKTKPKFTNYISLNIGHINHYKGGDYKWQIQIIL